MVARVAADIDYSLPGPLTGLAAVSRESSTRAMN